MRIKFFFTLLFILNLLVVLALDSTPSHDVTALHQSKLVVTAKIIPGKDYKFSVVINDILKKASGIELETGDKIKLMVPEFGSFGTNKRVYESEYILYLNPGNNYWVLQFGEQHIRATEKGLIPFDVCDRTYLLSPKDYRQMNRDLFMCFIYKNSYRYSAKLTPAQYKEKYNPLDVVFQFYRCYKDLIHIDQYIEEYEFLGPEFLHMDTTIYDFCETEPGLLLSHQEFADLINTSIPDSISNNEYGIEGRIYIKFVIEQDSTGSQFQVVRGINKSYDAFALNLIKKIGIYKPGTIKGEAVRSYYIIPINIRRE